MRLVSDAIRSRYRSILLFALVGTALAGIAAWAWPQAYTSTADVMLTPSVGNALAPDSARSGDQINVAMQTEAALIVSPPVAALVSEDVGDDVEPGDVGVTATVLPNTQIIRIEYSADTADEAVDMAGAYASALRAGRARLYRGTRARLYKGTRTCRKARAPVQRHARL